MQEYIYIYNTEKEEGKERKWGGALLLYILYNHYQLEWKENVVTRYNTVALICINSCLLMHR